MYVLGTYFQSLKEHVSAVVSAPDLREVLRIETAYIADKWTMCNYDFRAPWGASGGLDQGFFPEPQSLT